LLLVSLANDRELLDHERIGITLNADMHFAHPYTSWKRSTNENTSGLARQLFPMGTCLLQVRIQKLQSTIYRLSLWPVLNT